MRMISSDNMKVVLDTDPKYTKSQALALILCILQKLAQKNQESTGENVAEDELQKEGSYNINTSIGDGQTSLQNDTNLSETNLKMQRFTFQKLITSKSKYSRSSFIQNFVIELQEQTREQNEIPKQVPDIQRLPERQKYDNNHVDQKRFKSKSNLVELTEFSDEDITNAMISSLKDYGRLKFEPISFKEYFLDILTQNLQFIAEVKEKKQKIPVN